jgi:hypothetical protein
MEPVITLVGCIIILVLAGPVSWLQAKISARYDFCIASWPVILLAICLLILPTPLYIAYISPCQRLETYHYVGTYLSLAVISIPLVIINTRRTNKFYGGIATFLQLTLFAIALSIGLLPPVLFEMWRPVDGSGRLKYCSQGD